MELKVFLLVLGLTVFCPSISYAVCPPSYIGDGWCDAACNNRENKFDDGDCCENICLLEQKKYPCGVAGYNCLIEAPVPTWFTQTELCFKWRSESHNGQCDISGSIDRELCAEVDSRTEVYRDDTDRRSGGCQMQWAIRSPFAPAWFSDGVQICYRWYADGNGQCNAGAPILCANVGSFTAEYRDDTDRRSGGCQMSWMLSVPTNSPNWLRNVKICYYWYPDGDSGQCGGGAARTLCASANTWTDYYRDDTDGRSGGCRMSWALTF